MKAESNERKSMSHLIVEGIDQVLTPAGNQWEKTWHGLQTPVVNGISKDGSNVPNVFCPIVQCGLKPDYSGTICTIPEDSQDDTTVQLADYKLILADCSAGLSGNGASGDNRSR